ncbi:hypothetical protein BC831DRAFT_510286 [Entophlyctis helioformis]|nr:hypothetical protein BC831DRAFT_510286 [Entophlyctis helioformis]
MSPMDVDGADGAKIVLEVLSLTNEARNMYGLRQQDYQRYRTYCARKIHRVRKASGFSQGTKRRYERKVVTADTIGADDKALQSLLFEAERAWAYAMQLRADSQYEPRKKHHLVKRLVRAAQAAKSLETLCQDPAVDSRSALEAQAYSSLLAAYLAFERQQWQAALDLFVSSRAIYEQLALVASSPAQATLYQAAIDEIDPNIRYCAYNLRSSKTAGNHADIASLLELRSKSTGPGSDLLASKLESLLAQNLHLQAAKSHVVPWRGLQLQVGNEKLMAIVIETRELGVQVAKETEAVVAALKAGDDDKSRVDELLALYDKLIGLGWDAAKLAEKDIKEDAIAVSKVKSSKSDEHTEMLRNIFSFVSFDRLQHTLDRGALLSEIAAAQLQAQARTGTTTGDRRPVRRDELVRLDLSVLQTLKEMAELPIMQTDAALSHIVASRTFACIAQRLAHTADLYTAESKIPEALALLTKALENVQLGRADLNKVKPKTLPHNQTPLDTARLAALEQRIRGEMASCHARWLLTRDETAAPTSITDAMGSLALDGDAPARSLAVAPNDFSGRMSEFFQPRDVSAGSSSASAATTPGTKGKRPKRGKSGSLAAGSGLVVQHIPPTFEDVAFKPILYDLAYGGIQFPTGNIRALSRGGARVTRMLQQDGEAGGATGSASPPSGFLGGVLGSLWGSKGK